MLNRFLFLMIISCSLGFAHSLKVFAKSSDNALEIKGYYYGGSACKGCVVELRDENGTFASLELDEKSSVFLEFLKGFGSILAIFIIFGVIYFAKKKR